MKADRCGTLTEQRLYRMNWESKCLLPERQCEKCAHFELDFDRSTKGTPRCQKHGVRTLLRATCSSWEAKGEKKTRWEGGLNGSLGQ